MTELNSLESHNEGSSFEECFEVVDKTPRPEVLKSPFEESDTILVKDMPSVVAVADPHMIASQSSREGVRGMASFKRMLLGEFSSIRNRTRMLDTVARSSYRTVMRECEKHLPGNGIFMILGDTVMGSEASNSFSSFNTIEKSIDRLNKSVNKGNESNNISVFNLVGNHYSFTGIESGDYRNMAKVFETVDKEIFTQLSEKLKNGYSWDSIISAWMRYREGLEKPQRVLHPMQKWYLEKLTFGSQVGRYVKEKDGKIVSQVVFLDNLIEEGGTSEDLDIVFKALHISPEDKIYVDIKEVHKIEEDRQKRMIETMLNDSKAGIKTVVYTHLPELMQDRLVGYASKQFNWDDLTARKFVEDSIQVW